MSRRILSTPRHDLLGRLLEWGAGMPVVGAQAARFQRVRRKRFLAELKRGGSDSRIREVLGHEEGRRFGEALARWIPLGAVEHPGLPPIKDPFPGGASSRCSVIINTVDRASELAITLADIRRLWNPDLDELIVVLGPSSGESEAVITGSGVPCKLVHCPERNLALSRNLGLMAASGRFVVYIDDDASPEPGWLEGLVTPLENDPRVVAAAGFVLDGAGDRFLDRFVVTDTLGRSVWCDSVGSADAEIAKTGPHRAFLRAVGCNMAFRRDALLTQGGFDPAYRYFLEETDMILRLGRSGGRCVAAPDSRVRHRLGHNPARGSRSTLDDRLTLIRSLLHYLRKFAFGTFSSPEIEACVWQRVLADLEKIAWDHTGSGEAGEVQKRYLHQLTAELDPPPGGN